MVRTRAQGPATNSAGPPARRTRSKTTKKPQSSPTKLTKPTKKCTTKQKVFYIEVPCISLGLGPSASSAPRREQASENGRQKQCMSLDYFFKFRRGDDILSVSPSKSVSPQRMQAAIRPATPYASPFSSHSSVTSSTPTPHDLDTIPTIPAEQKEKLGIQGVTYADLDHEDLETRQKMSNTQFPSPVDERNDAGAYDDDSEWGGCTFSLGPASPPGEAETDTERQSTSPSLPPANNFRSWPSQSGDGDTHSSQPHSESPTPQQKAVDALQLYVTSSMGVEAITDQLQSLLGKLSSEWFEAIGYATVEPGDAVEDALQALEEHILSLLKSVPLHQRPAVRVVVSPPTNIDENHKDDPDNDLDDDDDGSSDWGADREKEKELKRKKRERTRRIREKNGEVVSSESETSSEEETDDEDPPLLSKRLHVGADGRRKGKPASKPSKSTKKIPGPDSEKSLNGVLQDSDTDNNEDKDEDASGRIPAVMKADVWKIRAEYEAKMEAVATQYKHSLQSAYRAAGEIAVVSRDPNLFNIFEKWWVAEDGNNSKVPDSTNPGTFFGQKWKDCRQEKLGKDWNELDKVEEAFGFLRTWHSEHYSNDLKVAKGPTRHDVKAVAKIISDMAKQAALN
ncbi:hypothetical protein VKT23_014632 [Stygiomarasmius scandens]|uniref:Uncharacterized protein n=1 Tax=Marasmiellus scandens TaxID=2682957 RepID=A0ABR1J289_9AGAR